uniref:Uncharacterized protein n=1 Tax=Anguilla anguilla TaxID=7936 RepID=A0A0E9WCM6_ANGAN
MQTTANFEMLVPLVINQGSSSNFCRP